MNNESEVRICKKCGTTIEGDIKYCPNCGSPLNQNERSSKKKGHKLLIAVLVAAGLCIFASIGGSNNEAPSHSETEATAETDSRSGYGKQADESNQIASNSLDNHSEHGDSEAGTANSQVWSEYDSNNQYANWMNYLWELEYLYTEPTKEVRQFVSDGLNGVVWTNGQYSFTFKDSSVIIEQNSLESEYDYKIIAVCGSSMMEEGYNTFDAVVKISNEYLYLGRKVAYLEDDSPYLMLSGINSDGLTDGIALDTYDKFAEYGMEDYAPESSSEFIEKVWAEESTQSNMNVGQLIRDPNQYCDGNMYRFSGYVDSIRRDEYQSWATLKVENSLVVINYPGWIGAVQGDQLTVYGYVVGIGEYSNSVQGTVQTADIDVVYYTVGADSVFCDFTDEQWDFILGDWYSNDSDKYIESTVTLTKDTINGRTYTINKTGIGTTDVSLPFGSNANLLCGQYLILDITEEAANGETIDATLMFYFNGKTSHVTFGSKSETYYYDVLYKVDYHR